MKTDEVRESYLKFFVSKGHTICPSDSLVPENDPSLLFTGAGMNQFKDMFLGKGNLAFSRATTAQKCLRTGDIDKVGKTASHHTFFEMLGNFSFGDYFKEETIAWAWEYLTLVLKLPKELLTVSVYEQDDEAYDIWRRKIGLEEKKIYRFGAVDNFWPSNAPADGPNGPCGPCSEIFFDRGPAYGCGSSDCQTGCSCNRFVEIWNLVFTQFDRQDDGSLKPLPRKNIDTGMGLERMASVVQKVPTNFDIDIFTPIIAAIQDAIGVKYEPNTENAARMKRIADHIRAAVFLISDGVLPSNEERGYVERKLIRRALTDGREIGYEHEFLYKIVPAVVDVMHKQYPELKERRENISRIIKSEEKDVLEVVERGPAIWDEIIKEQKAKGKKEITGLEIFKLWDTYGYSKSDSMYYLTILPIDKGLPISRNWEQEYDQAMEQQKKKAQAASNISKDIFDKGPLAEVKSLCKPTAFTGYGKTRDNITVIAVVKDDKIIKKAGPKEKVLVITDRTPFYGESGGQAGDTGIMKNDHAELRIYDTKKIESYICHYAEIVKGLLEVGARLEAVVDLQRRLDIARNHTATHLLQNALRVILGKHVEQAGSFVAHDRLRFDFTHFQQVNPEELKRVEEFVNEKIMADSPVSAAEKNIKDAKKEGALAFFGEKYAEQVRVVSIGDYSRELCGGTHLDSTGQIGLFRIVVEGSVASGTRRIEAVTGRCALKLITDERDTIRLLGAFLNTTGDKLQDRVRALQEEIKTLKNELQKAKKETSSGLIDKLVHEAFEAGGEKFAVVKLDDATADDLRKYSDTLVKDKKMGGFLGITTTGGKVNALLRFRPDLVSQKKLDARQVLNELAKGIGGSGGGRPDMAQAGGKDVERAGELVPAFAKAMKDKMK